MILALNQPQPIIPDHFRHDPILINNKGNTVAMIFAYNGNIPPEEWEHDPNFKNY